MKSRKDGSERSTKKVWSSPELRFVGQISDIVQGGGGKLSTQPADPGESNIPRPKYTP